MVSTSTLRPGASPLAIPSTSKPSRPGMARSSTRTSACVSRSSLSAASPSATSATTETPGWDSRMRRTPARTREWSSASTTRILAVGFTAPDAPGGPRRRIVRRGFRDETTRSRDRSRRDGGLQPAPLARGALDRQCSSQGGDTLADPEQPEVRRGLAGEAATVVLDGQAHAAVLDPDPHIDPARRGVAGHVGERLLHHAEERHLELRPEGCERLVDLERGVDAGAAAEVLDQTAQRRHQAQVERRGPQQIAQVANLGERLPHHLARLAASLEVELDLDRGQHLAGLVVELAGDAPPLVLLGAQELVGELLELEVALLEGAPPVAQHQEQRADRG